MALIFVGEVASAIVYVKSSVSSSEAGCASDLKTGRRDTADLPVKGVSGVKKRFARKVFFVK